MSVLICWGIFQNSQIPSRTELNCSALVVDVVVVVYEFPLELPFCPCVKLPTYVRTNKYTE